MFSWISSPMNQLNPEDFNPLMPAVKYSINFKSENSNINFGFLIDKYCNKYSNISLEKSGIYYRLLSISISHVEPGH